MTAIEIKKTNINTSTVVSRNFFGIDEVLNFIKECDRRMYRISAAKIEERFVIFMNYLTNNSMFENVQIFCNDNYTFNMICKTLDLE